MKITNSMVIQVREQNVTDMVSVPSIATRPETQAVDKLANYAIAFDWCHADNHNMCVGVDEQLTLC